MFPRFKKKNGIAALLGAILLIALAAGVCRSELISLQTPINYNTAKPDDPIARLQKKINNGEVSLAFEKEHGYLPAVLKAIGVPVSSQTLVFSKTSFQRELIAPWRPRALYFNNDAYIGWVQGGQVLEVAAVDKQLGAVFYTLEQSATEKPQFRRQGINCLQCHEGSMTENIPGLVMRSVYTEAGGAPKLDVTNYLTNNSSPFQQRWGGWYVTGTQGSMHHMGNLLLHSGDVPESADLSQGANIQDLSAKFDNSVYLSPGSDVVALMVLGHQTELHNLLTNVNYQTRLAMKNHPAPLDEPRVKEACEALIREMLFCKEATLSEPVVGSSTFTRDFPAGGPHDKQGRSLRNLDLSTRLFKYPCSYLIYTESFASLPTPAKEYIYRRLWEIYNGRDGSGDFIHVTPADGRAVIGILRDTVADLPEYWTGH